MTRTITGALVALLLFASAAEAQEVVPLAGKGENIQPIARVKIPRPNEIELAGDWAFVSTDAFEEQGGRLVIVNIADPTKPFVEGVWDSKAAGIDDQSYGDVDLSPDGNMAVLTNAHGNASEGEGAWAVLIDTTDKAHPKLLGQVTDDATTDYVHTSTLDNKTLYLNPQVAAFYPQPGNAAVSVVDISDPTHPKITGKIAPPGADAGLAHDTYVDHRPDGKTLMYAASVHKSDVIDITKPLESSWMQTATWPSYTISHDVQPNHDRSIIVVDDEGAAGGQLDEGVSACGRAGAGPATADSGSVHFFQAAADGTFEAGGALHLGSFNAPTNANTGACVAHVFWQAPNENRLTQAYYRTGAFVIDFADPANAKMLGWFLADGGAEYWSNKPHRGYMFATDMEHGVDILKYSGEGGSRWPATAGPAEVQRSARQGVPYVPIKGTATTPLPPAGPKGGDTRALGRFTFTAKVKKVPGKKRKKTRLTLAFTNAAGKAVGSVRFSRTAAKKATIKVAGVAVAGSYKWTLKAGSKVLKKGSVTVAKQDGLALAPNATLAARVVS